MSEAITFQCGKGTETLLPGDSLTIENPKNLFGGADDFVESLKEFCINVLVKHPKLEFYYKDSIPQSLTIKYPENK